MQYRDILVHIDTASGSRACLDVAIAMARTHEAELQAVHVVTPPAVIAPASISPPAGLIKKLRAEQQRIEQEAREAYQVALADAGLEGEWRTLNGTASDVLVREARRCDLLVLGQEMGEESMIDRHGLPDTLVLECGRPVLVVPYVGAGAKVGRRIMIAWNGGREAVRAVNDALPMLVRADHVVLLSVDSAATADREASGANLARHLARHGVDCEIRNASVDQIEVGDLLLSRAADEGVDLLVMGAYGRSRFRELILGGATRHLLAHMTVPVLMSH